MQLLVDKLRCRRGQRRVITDLSFSLGSALFGQESGPKERRGQKGQSLKITGPNGAGKTTLLRCLAGLLKPHAGRVELQFSDDCSYQGQKGQSDRETSAAMRFGADYAVRSMVENLHFISHTNGLKNSLNVEQNLIFWARFYGGQATSDLGEKIEDVMEEFDLLDLASIPAGFLSAGQKRRLALARFLIVPRPLWLMDEPFVSLDQDNIALICRHIRNHIASGGLAIVSTHMDVDITFDQHLVLTPALYSEEQL